MWGGFEARTDASALGNTVNNETGEQEQSTAGIDFGKIQLLIVDEAYLCVFENILKLKRKMRENPEMKVVFLGCPYQCEQIVKERENSVWCRPIAESLDDLFARMFPHRVVLRINKRSPDDSFKLSAIKRMLFEEKQSTGEVLRHMIDQKWVGGVLRSDEEIVRNNLTYLEEVIQYEGPKNIAAMFIETVTGTNGILPPPKGYLKGLKALLEKHGILLVTDEVMCGWGRTGKLFAFQHGDIVVSVDTAARAAIEHGHGLDEELLIYIVHGFLHLNGYDDADEEERAAMHVVQDKVWRAVLECLSQR